MKDRNSSGQRKPGVPGITLEQKALLLIILENGQKGSTQEEIREKAEREGIYFSDSEILTNLKGLKAMNLVRSGVSESIEKWYPVLEVA